MNRHTPMKRTAIARKAPPMRPVKTYEHFTPRARPVALRVPDTRDRAVVTVAKDAPIQHQGYMGLVRALPCAMCGRRGPSQFCHADQGKGLALKSDCRLGWPGCGPHDGRPGCHWFVGSSGRMGKQARREFEAAAAARTRVDILATGKWPERLPLWKEGAT